MGQTIEVSIDNHGGILLPMELKSRLGLSPGMTMVVEEDDEERLCLRVQTESPELVDKQGIVVVRAKSSEDLANITRRARDRRAADLRKEPTNESSIGYLRPCSGNGRGAPGA